MNRKKISKGLKILSIASAVVICSTTIVTAERASSAGFWSRLTGGLRRIFTGKNSSSGSANLSTSVSNRNSVLPNPSSPQENLRVRFGGIKSDSGKSKSVTGILDLKTGNSTTNGNVGGGSGDDIRIVAKMDKGGRDRSKINTSGTDTNQVKFPTGTVEDGLHYAALGARPKIKTQSGGATTSTATGNNTIYTIVKSKSDSGATSSQTQSSSQVSTSTANTGGGRKPVPAPRTKPNLRPITQTTTQKTGSGSNESRIPAKPKMTLNERLGLDQNGKRIRRTDNQTTTTTTTTATSSNKEPKLKKSAIPKLELSFKFGGKKNANQPKQTTPTTKTSTTPTSNKTPQLPEKSKNLPKRSGKNDWEELAKQSRAYYGPDKKLDKYGLPKSDDVEREFQYTDKPGYGGTIMILRPKR